MYKNHYDYNGLTQVKMPAELGLVIPAELSPPPPELEAQSTRKSGEREGFSMSNKVTLKDIEAVPEGVNNSKKNAVINLPDDARTNPYPDRSWNLLNDHYDSGVTYDKMYGALAQAPATQTDYDDPYYNWRSAMGVFAAPRIYQGVDEVDGY